MNWFTAAGRSIFHPWAARQRRLAASRPPLTREEFITAIAARGGDADAAGLIRDHLETWGLEPGFTPSPDDDFLSIFGIAEEELEVDLFMNLLTRLAVPHPTTEMLREFGSVDTPLQIARLVSHLRRG